MYQFCELNTGANKVTKAALRSLFSPDRMPPMSTTRAKMLFLYIIELAQRFEIYDGERTASVHRAQLALFLTALSTQLPMGAPGSSLTPSDLESAAWRDRDVRAVRGLPWSVREHVFHHACSAQPWKPMFVADRLARNELVHIQKRRSVFVTICEDRFVNTTVCWYRNDPFVQVPRDILEFVCTFVCQRDLLNMIDSSRSLADACCHWIRRVHTKDPSITRAGIRRKYSEIFENTLCSCGQLCAKTCTQGRCGACCDDDSGCNRHRNKRSHVRRLMRTAWS
jgi:hypothetical protein